MPAHRLAEVLAEVRDRDAPHGTRLVGVDGPSASGKSSLARRLADLAGAPLVEVDELWTWGDDPRWWRYLVDQVLRPLSEGRRAQYRLRDWAGGGFAGRTTIAAAPVVVVEGVTCTRAEVAGLYAYRIWVDAPRAVRLERGVARDGEARRASWVRWLDTEDEFFAADGTPARADLRVDGDPPEPPSRFAVPLADLDAVQVTQRRMVELVGDGLQPPELGASSGVGPDGDGDGE